MKEVTKKELTKDFEVKTQYTTAHLKRIAVLSTPSLVLLVERTAAELAAPFLDEGEGTVGTAIALEHLDAVKKGGIVTISVVLKKTEGRRLDFEFTAVSGDRSIGRGSHSRFVVDIQRFAARIVSGEK